MLHRGHKKYANEIKNLKIVYDMCTVLMLFRNFENDQKEKQANVMEKILLEEERMRRRKLQQPLLWDDPQREKSKVSVMIICILDL